jgi:hypothetical protein
VGQRNKASGFIGVVACVGAAVLFVFAISYAVRDLPCQDGKVAVRGVIGFKCVAK